MAKYVIGDIHGSISKLLKLLDFLLPKLSPNDIIIFLGDYIDRGEDSFGVVETIIKLQELHKNVYTLMGNHEDMLRLFIADPFSNRAWYMANGGGETINSYKKRGYNIELGEMPESHQNFYNNLLPYYEDDEIIAVHGGLDPHIERIKDQKIEEMLWIREKFIFHPKRYKKKVFFGHTPTIRITGSFEPFLDKVRNIYGIDTGAVYGGKLTLIEANSLKYWQF
jgi:serine/threonine protein phosphatase 1